MNQEFITTALFSQNQLSNNTQRMTDQKNYHNHRSASALRKINYVNLNSPENYHNHRSASAFAQNKPSYSQ